MSKFRSPGHTKALVSSAVAGQRRIVSVRDRPGINAAARLAAGGLSHQA
jgi:hypothetical protein